MTFGEAMVSLRADGLIRLGTRYESSIAGAESNVAIGLSRLGHRVAWVGTVGADQQGQFVLRTLRAEGVEVSSLVDSSRPTGLVMVEQRLGSTSRVSYYRSQSAGSTVSEQEVKVLLSPEVKLLHVTGITASLSPTAARAVNVSVAAAKEMGITVSFDVNYRSQLWSKSDAREILRPLALQADLVMGSPEELELVGDGSADEVTQALISHGAIAVVIKRGPAGVTLVTPDDLQHVQALGVEVNSTVGAGDAFVAGFLSGYLAKLDFKDAAYRGVACAAFSVSTPGDWEGLPTPQELHLLTMDQGDSVR